MSNYDEITAARILLELPERASMAEIKASYRKLIRKWHPDKCKKTPQACKEMSARINAAYKLIMAYCEEYRFSFSEEEVLEHATEQDLWVERFGKDSSWGMP